MGRCSQKRSFNGVHKMVFFTFGSVRLVAAFCRRKRIGKLAVAAAALACSLLSAFPFDTAAYVLQGPHLLELMAESMGRAHRLNVTQRVVVYGEDRQADKNVMPETLRWISPAKIRSDIHTDTIHRIRVASGDMHLTVIDGEIAGNAVNRYDSYTEILQFRSRQELVTRLGRYGVDTGISSLGRFEGRIVYIIGDRYPSTDRSQLWIDQKTFRPLRWLVAEKGFGAGERLLDIRYLEWKALGKIWYPFRIAFLSGDRLMREIRVDDVDVDPELDEGLFDIGKLRALYRAPAEGEGERAGEETLSEIQKVIEEFKKKYE